MTPDKGPYPTLRGEGAKRLAAGAARIVVVGAGGWLGLATLEALHGLLGEAFTLRVACFGSNARQLILRGGLSVWQQPLARLADLPPTPTLVLHLAFLTQEKVKAMSAAEYTAINQAVSGQVLASLDAIGAEAVFVPSSGAVYLVDDATAEPSKRLYGKLKLKDEARFARWAAAKRKRSVIARVFNLSGPYINKRSSYALACFIADALADRPIAIKADRPVLRSYVAIDELMSVVFGLLTDGTVGATLFDAAGKRGYEMMEIAAAVALALGHGRGVQRQAVKNLEADRYVGDGTVYASLRRDLAVEPVEFSRQVRETAKFMAEFPLTV